MKIYKDFTDFEADLINLKGLKQIERKKVEKKPFLFDTNKIFSLAATHNSVPRIDNVKLLSNFQAQLLEEIKEQNK